MVQGARQVGKSTLAKHVLGGRPGRWLSLDDTAAFAAAQADPDGFVRQGDVPARLANVTADALAPGVASDLAGGLVEAFVAGELRRQLGWADTTAQLFHFRDRNGLEVDLVLEDGSGRVAGIEVKALSVRADDFRGLAGLRDRLGPRFVAGVVLHPGVQALPFGDRLGALPLSSLWAAT